MSLILRVPSSTDGDIGFLYAAGDYLQYNGHGPSGYLILQTGPQQRMKAIKQLIDALI